MKLKMPVPNSLFRIGLLFMILKVFLSLSHIIEMPYSLDMILSVVASCFLIASVLQKRFPLKTLLVFALFTGVGLVTSVRTGNMMMFIAIITCLSVCGEDLDEAIRFLLYAEGLLVIIIALVSVIMHIMGYSMMIRVSGVMQYGFGFSHPNVFACIVTNLFAMYLWLHFDTARFHNFFLMLLTEFVVFLITDSRTGLLVTLFLVLIVALCRVEKLHKIVQVSAMYALPVLTAFFYTLCKLFAAGYTLIQLLDMGLSGRIRLSAYAMERFGVSMLGQNITGVQVKWDEFWRVSGIAFDNVYTYLLVTQFIWLIVVAILFFILAKKGNVKRCVFILAWAFYGISEIHVINPFLFFTILIVTFLFKREEEMQTDEQ